MGDFSIRCDLSGIPIPCGTKILVLEMGISERHPEYYFPLGLPTLQTMGSYGKADDVDDAFYKKGHLYYHILPDMWRAAAKIWTKAMFGYVAPKFADEILQVREEYKKRLIQCEKYKGSDSYASLVELRLDSTGEWMRRFKDIVLFAPNFGADNPVTKLVLNTISFEKLPSKVEMQQMQDFIAVFMSSCITGVDLRGGNDRAHPFEQYPELKWDLLWAQAKVEAIKNIQRTL